MLAPLLLFVRVAMKHFSNSRVRNLAPALCIALAIFSGVTGHAEGPNKPPPITSASGVKGHGRHHHQHAHHAGMHSAHTAQQIQDSSWAKLMDTSNRLLVNQAAMDAMKKNNALNAQFANGTFDKSVYGQIKSELAKQYEEGAKTESPAEADKYQPNVINITNELGGTTSEADGRGIGIPNLTQAQDAEVRNLLKADGSAASDANGNPSQEYIFLAKEIASQRGDGSVGSSPEIAKVDLPAEGPGFALAPGGIVQLDEMSRVLAEGKTQNEASEKDKDKGKEKKETGSKVTAEHIDSELTKGKAVALTDTDQKAAAALLGSPLDRKSAEKKPLSPEKKDKLLSLVRAIKKDGFKAFRNLFAEQAFEKSTLAAKTDAAFMGGGSILAKEAALMKRGLASAEPAPGSDEDEIPSGLPWAVGAGLGIAIIAFRKISKRYHQI